MTESCSHDSCQYLLISHRFRGLARNEGFGCAKNKTKQAVQKKVVGLHAQPCMVKLAIFLENTTGWLSQWIDYTTVL